MEENMQALMERLNSSSQFLQSNDMRVTEVRHGFAKVEMIIDEQILNIHGFVHGGALFSLADTVAGAASFATGRDSVTLTGTINYIKPGRGGKLIGIAQEISSGKTTGVYEVFIFNDENVLLSRATFTMFFLDSDKMKKKKSRNKTALFVYLNALLNLSKGDSDCPDFNSSYSSLSLRDTLRGISTCTSTNSSPCPERDFTPFPFRRNLVFGCVPSGIFNSTSPYTVGT